MILSPLCAMCKEKRLRPRPGIKATSCKVISTSFVLWNLMRNLPHHSTFSCVNPPTTIVSSPVAGTQSNISESPHVMCMDAPLSAIHTSRPGGHRKKALLPEALLPVSARRAGKAPRQSCEWRVDVDVDGGGCGCGDCCTVADCCSAYVCATDGA